MGIGHGAPPARLTHRRKRGSTRRFCLPLFSILVDRDRADLAGAADMRAAAGLQIDAGDFDEAHAPDARRRLDRHRAHQLGLGGELVVGDPARRRPRGGSAISALSRPAIVSLSRPTPGTSKSSRPLPSETCPPVTAPGTTRAQQMQAGVHAHQPVAPLPVDLGGHRLAERGSAEPGAGTWITSSAAVALDRVDDRDRRRPRPAAARRCRPAGRRRSDRTRCGRAGCRARRPRSPGRAGTCVGVVAKDQGHGACRAFLGNAQARL